MNISDSISLFLDYLSTDRRLSGHTITGYGRDLHDLCDYLAGQQITTLSDLEARDLRAWQMQHTEAGERPATIKRRLSALSSWLRFLRHRGLLDRDLMAKLTIPRQPKRLPIFFRRSETEHLYDEGLFANDLYGQRDALMLRILYETGIRRAELAALTEADIDLTMRTIKVLGKGNKQRLIPIENELAHNISTYLALKHQERPDSNWLFPGKRTECVSPSSVYTIVRRYMTTLSHADRISPHVFRHSFATGILSEGGDLEALRQLLGHSSLAATELYTHVTREHLKETYRQAHPRGHKKE